MWFGLNEVAAIVAVSLNKIPMVAVIMKEKEQGQLKKIIDVAKFYKISGNKFFKVILQLYPYLLSSARSGLSLTENCSCGRALR